MTHLWEYESLADRANVRAKLAADPEWLGEYVSHLLPMLDAQVNSIVYEPAWAEGLKATEPAAGPYLMETMTLTRDAAFLDDELRGLVEGQKGADLVNILYTDIGPKNVVTVIWQVADLPATQSRISPGIFR